MLNWNSSKLAYLLAAVFLNFILSHLAMTQYKITLKQGEILVEEWSKMASAKEICKWYKEACK